MSVEAAQEIKPEPGVSTKRSFFDELDKLSTQLSTCSAPNKTQKMEYFGCKNTTPAKNNKKGLRLAQFSSPENSDSFEISNLPQTPQTPTNGILKNINSPSVSDKKKRVHFPQNLNQFKFFEDIQNIRKRNYENHQEGTISDDSNLKKNSIDSKDIFVPLEEDPIENRENTRTDEKTDLPFMPELCEVKDSVKAICNKLSIKGSTSLHLRLKNKNICTVGDFARLSENEILELPIRLPFRVGRARKELSHMYSNIINPGNNNQWKKKDPEIVENNTSNPESVTKNSTEIESINEPEFEVAKNNVSKKTAKIFIVPARSSMEESLEEEYLENDIEMLGNNDTEVVESEADLKPAVVRAEESQVVESIQPPSYEHAQLLLDNIDNVIKTLNEIRTNVELVDRKVHLKVYKTLASATQDALALLLA